MRHATSDLTGTGQLFYALFNVSGPLFFTFPNRGLEADSSICSDS